MHSAGYHPKHKTHLTVIRKIHTNTSKIQPKTGENKSHKRWGHETLNLSTENIIQAANTDAEYKELIKSIRISGTQSQSQQ